MSRYLGPESADDQAVMNRLQIANLIDVRVEVALAAYEEGGSGGNVNPMYVRAAATGNADGSDFDNAYSIYNLGSAIANAAPGATVHILCTDTYTDVGNINVPAYATTHLSDGNEVTIQASDAGGSLVLPIDPTTDYATPAEAVAAAQAMTSGYTDQATADAGEATLWAAVYADDTFDYTGDALILNGTRTADTRTTAEQFKTPIDATDWTQGSPIFSLNGVSHLIFKGIGFRNAGNGCFLFNGRCDNIHFEDCAARNVYRYIEFSGSSNSDDDLPYTWTNGSDTRSDVRGSEREIVRIKNASDTIDIVDPHWDCRRVNGDGFPSGSHIQGTAVVGPADVTIRGDTRVGVIANNYHYRSDGKYRNGDGVATERSAGAITLENLLLVGFTDGGVDSKAPDGALTMTDVIAMSNKRNFRVWNTNPTNPYGPVYSIRPLYRGGSGGPGHIHVNDADIEFDEAHLCADVGATVVEPAASGDSAIINAGTVASPTAPPYDDVTLDVSVNHVSATSRPRAVPEIYGVAALGVSATELSVSWDPDGGHDTVVSPTASYDIEVDSVVQTGFTTSAAVAVVTGLTAETEYEIRVRGRNTADEVGEWSLLTAESTASTLPTAVSSFSDDFSTNNLAANYEYFGVVPDQWQFVGDGTVNGPSGGNGQRYMSPSEDFGSGHRVAATVTSWDETRGAGVVARFAGNTGVRVEYVSTGQWRLVDMQNSGGVVLRTLTATAPAVPFDVSIEVEDGLHDYTCKVDDVEIDWDGAGETSVTVSGHTAGRVAVSCADDDSYFGSVDVVAL